MAQRFYYTRGRPAWRVSGSHFGIDLRLANCAHFTAKYTQKTYFTLICTKSVCSILRCVVMVRVGACVVRVDSVLNSGIYFGTNKCSP